jgi:hypothetical protein
MATGFSAHQHAARAVEVGHARLAIVLSANQPRRFGRALAAIRVSDLTHPADGCHISAELHRSSPKDYQIEMPLSFRGNFGDAHGLSTVLTCI